MVRLTVVLLAFTLLLSSAHAGPPVAGISALASGKLLQNGNPTDLATIEAELKNLRTRSDVVWYYRENAQADPPAPSNVCLGIGGEVPSSGKHVYQAGLL